MGRSAGEAGEDGRVSGSGGAAQQDFRHSATATLVTHAAALCSLTRLRFACPRLRHVHEQTDARRAASSLRVSVPMLPTKCHMTPA